MATLPIEFQQTEADEHRAWELARRCDNWPGYDIVYVTLAERIAEPLVTPDNPLLQRFAHPGSVVARMAAERSSDQGQMVAPEIN